MLFCVRVWNEKGIVTFIDAVGEGTYPFQGVYIQSPAWVRQNLHDIYLNVFIHVKAL